MTARDSFDLASADEATKPRAATDNAIDNNFFMIFPFPISGRGKTRPALRKNVRERLL
jgi:hypothetical protein